ncbi:MAG: hypothetical protein HKN23_16085 [Verrucomicrobiales bacterium]|nr:hypothetical protein [Verrucomicrobiales bacterium]
MKRILFTACAFASTATISAAPPTLDYFYPAGGKVGTEVEVTFAGKMDPWPAKAWSSNSEVTFVADEKTKGKFTAKISAKAKPGPVLVRVHNPEGVSPARIFVVGSAAEISEDAKEKHSALSTSQKLEQPMPLTVNGKVAGRNEVDFYTVSLKKGQTLHALVDGYAIKSLMDPMLHLYGPNGGRIRVAHDGPVNLDPRFSFPVPAEGDYSVGVAAIGHPPNANVHLHGANSAVYRLYLATDPKSIPAHLQPVSDPDSPKPAEGKPLAPPFEFVSTLTKQHTPERIAIATKKGDKFRVKVEAFTLGFATDPVLRIFKPDGVLLREIDDVKPNRDAEYPLAISLEGDWSIEVADRFGRAGGDIRYRLSVQPQVPDFSATTDKADYVVEAGGEAEAKVTVTRVFGDTATLKIEVKGLPAGVETEIAEVPEKTGPVSVKLKAKPDTKPFSGPIQFVVSEPEGEEKRERVAVFSFQDKDARGPYLIDEVTDLWLTVTAKAEEKKEGDAAAKK